VERERETQILQALTARATQTDLQREEGDYRLLAATRRGRSSIVQSLTQERPKALLEDASGTSASFLRHFNIREAVLKPPFKNVATFRSKMGVQDQTTLNLSYNRAAALRGLASQGWVRSIAFQLSEDARSQKCVGVIPEDELEANDLEGFPFWVLPPESVPVVRRLVPNAKVLPVAGSCCIGFPEDIVGEITVPENFASESHEIWDCWEVVGNLPYVMKVNLCHLRTLIISGIGADAHLVKRPS
jgi:hypothetical protein